MKVLIFVPEAMRADAEAAAKLFPRLETAVNPVEQLQDARAVFYLGDREWRQSMKDTYAHYHRSRRAFIFKKPSQLRKAIWLAGKQDSLIRWGALLPMATVFAAVLLLAVIFRDPLLHRGAIHALQGAFGARAEIARLSTTLTPSFELQRVTVADRRHPMQNLFEFDRLSGGAHLDQLLAGRVHIDELALEGLRFGSPRTESGALPEAPPPEPEPEVQAEGLRPLGEILESLIRKLDPLRPEDLQSVQRAREVQQEARRRLERLEQLRNLPKRLESFRGVTTEIESLRLVRRDLDDVAAVTFEEENQSIEQMRADVEKARRTIARAQDLAKKAREIKKVQVTDFLKVQALIGDMQKVVKELDDAARTIEETARKLEQTEQAVLRKRKDAEAKLTAAQQRIDEARTALQGEGLTERLARAAGEQKAQLEALKRDIESARRDIEDGIAYAREQPEALRQALESDRKMIEDRYSLERFRAEELIGSVVGDETVRWMRWGLWVHRMIQPVLNRKRPAKLKAPSGTTYLFGAPPDTPPKVWIRSVSFSGSHGPYRLEGRARNVSSDLARAGEAMTVSVRFENGTRVIEAQIQARPSGELAADLEARGLPIENVTLDNKYAPLNVGAGTVTLKLRAEFRADSVRANVRVSVEGLTLATDDRLNPRLAFLKDVCAGLRSVSAELSLVCSGGRITEFRCASPEGSELASAFRRALDAQVQTLKREAEGRIEALSAEPMRRANEACEAFLQKAPAALPADLSSRVDALLAASADPQKAAAALRTEMDALADRRAQESHRIAASAGEPSAAAQTVSQMLADDKGMIARVKADLKSEIERLIKGMK